MRNLPIVEYKKGDSDGFMKEMQRLIAKEKGGPERFELFIASGNRRIVLQPQVTTSRVNTLLIRDFEPNDVNKIKEAAVSAGVEVTKHWNFWFDERKEPPAKVPVEEKEETQG